MSSLDGSVRLCPFNISAGQKPAVLEQITHISASRHRASDKGGIKKEETFLAFCIINTAYTAYTESAQETPPEFHLLLIQYRIS